MARKASDNFWRLVEELEAKIKHERIANTLLGQVARNSRHYIHYESNAFTNARLNPYGHNDWQENQLEAFGKLMESKKKKTYVLPNGAEVEF